MKLQKLLSLKYQPYISMGIFNRQIHTQTFNFRERVLILNILHQSVKLQQQSVKL